MARDISIDADAFAGAFSQKAAGMTAGNAGSSTEPFAVESKPSTGAVDLQGKLFKLSVDVPDTSGLPKKEAWELSEEFYKIRMEQMQQRIDANKRYLEKQHTTHDEPDLSADPRLKTYATVVVAGEALTTLDNQGVLKTANGMSELWKGKLVDSINGKNGPDLAQARAEQIAKLLGGRIVYSETAIPQDEFNALPPFELKSTIDYEAMKNDPLYERLNAMTENFEMMKQQRADYLASQ